MGRARIPEPRSADARTASANKRARDLAEQLVAREAGNAPDGASAAYAAWQRAHAALGRWLGATGTHALVTRALSEAHAQHPSLRSLRVTPPPDPILEGLQASTRTHGVEAVAAGLTSALVGLFELLGRLIGEDMTARLVDPDGPRQPPATGQG